MYSLAEQEIIKHHRLLHRASLSYRDSDLSCDYDDLYQEGMIAVWRNFNKGYCARYGQTPHEQVVRNAMRKWKSYCRAILKGETTKAQEFWDLLHMEDYE